MTRITKQVKKCEKLSSPHWHIVEEDNVFCHGIGAWLKESTFITPKQLKEKWYGDKSRFKKKEE